MSILNQLFGGRALRSNDVPPPQADDTTTAPDSTAGLVPKRRTIVVDQEWAANLSEQSLTDHVFQRVSGKQILFTNVDFRYSTFDSCYLRSCTFVSCNFIGCRFIATNLRGSTFSGCDFEYAVFERTFIDADVLDSSPPPRENEKLIFARTLRTNYQALGDSDAVNKAILVELDATRVHRSKAWKSSEPYYRGKYAGLERFFAFLRWLRFVAGDTLWGNGERPVRLIRTAIVIVGLIAAADTVLARDPTLVGDWWSALIDAPQVLLGTKQPTYPGLILALITLTRYILLGLFVSILVRRYARR